MSNKSSGNITDIKERNIKKSISKAQKNISVSKIKDNNNKTSNLELKTIASEAKNFIEHQPSMVQIPDIEMPDWDTLKELYETIGLGIMEFAQAVKNNFDAIVNAGVSDNVLISLINTTMNDCKSFTEKLVLIKEKHANRSGTLKDPDELGLYYESGDAYNTLYEQFRLLSYQVSVEITTYLSGVVDSVNKDMNIQNIVESKSDEENKV